MILCTKENAQNNVSPKYEEILFWTVAAFKTDSSDTPTVLAFQIQFCLLNVTLHVMPTNFIFALVLPTSSKPKSERGLARLAWKGRNKDPSCNSKKQRKPEAKNHNSCSNIQMQAMPQSSLLHSTSKKSSLFTFSTKAKKPITRSERRMRGLQVPEVSRQGRTASTKRPDSPPPPREQVTITR